MTDPIAVDGLEKRRGDALALEDVAFSVRDGESFGLVGPAGAGKSTAIAVLLGLVRPTAGDVSVLGRDPRRDAREIRRRTGYLPEEAAPYDGLTAREHLEFAVESLDAADDPGRVLDRVGLREVGYEPARTLSRGETRRLVLAMGLVGNPELLLLDEPTAGLDPTDAHDVREVVREQRERGTTVLLSTATLERVAPVCDRVGVLRDGRLVAVDAVDEVGEAATAETEVRARR